MFNSVKREKKLGPFRAGIKQKKDLGKTNLDSKAPISSLAFCSCLHDILCLNLSSQNDGTKRE